MRRPAGHGGSLRIVDAHCHLLPLIDDGPGGWDEAEALLGMLAGALGSGSMCFASPHVRFSTCATQSSPVHARMDEYSAVVEKAAGGMRVGLAPEILLDAVSPVPPELSFMCFPGTNRLLVELPPRVPGMIAALMLGRLARHGFTLMLAHPERYRFVQRRISAVSSLASSGTALQISLRSLRSPSGAVRLTAESLLREGLCHVLASDCHHPGDAMLTECREEIEALSGRRAWDVLCRANPSAVVEGKEPVLLREALQ